MKLPTLSQESIDTLITYGLPTLLTILGAYKIVIIKIARGVGNTLTDIANAMESTDPAAVKQILTDADTAKEALKMLQTTAKINKIQNDKLPDENNILKAFGINSAPAVTNISVTAPTSNAVIAQP